MIAKILKEVLDHVETWSQEDQAELAEYARDIEARRTGVYTLNDEERSAIEEAERSPLASDEEVGKFWKRRDVA